MGITRKNVGGDGTHFHDGDTLQCDGVNSDGGAFAFTTTGAISIGQDLLPTDATVNLGAPNGVGFQTLVLREQAADPGAPAIDNMTLYQLDTGKAITLQGRTSGADDTIHTFSA